MRARYFLATVALSFVVCGVTLTNLESRGVIWNLTRTRLGYVEGFAPASALSALPAVADLKIAAVGGPEFVAAAERALGSDTRLRTCVIPNPDASDVADCVDAIGSRWPRLAIAAELHPFFFSDIVESGERPRFDVLDHDPAWQWWSMPRIRRAFELAGAWAGAGSTGPSTGAARQFDPMMSFVPETAALSRVRERAVSSGLDIYWVEAPDSGRYASAPRFWSAYAEARVRLAERLRPGQLVELNQLAGRFRTPK
ncbi:MAG: hypothetical protein AB7O21_02120 [Gammaproteobacteria bacterium]